MIFKATSSAEPLVTGPSGARPFLLAALYVRSVMASSQFGRMLVARDLRLLQLVTFHGKEVVERAELLACGHEAEHTWKEA